MGAVVLQQTGAQQVSLGCRVCMLLGGHHMLEQPVPAQHRRDASGIVLACQGGHQGGTDLLSVHTADMCPLVPSLKAPCCCSSLPNT